MATKRKRKRQKVYGGSAPADTSVLRIPLGEHAQLAVPSLTIVSGACLVPGPYYDENRVGNATRAGRDVLRALWNRVRAMEAVVLLDGEPLLDALSLDVLVAPEAPVFFREVGAEPFILTPREGGVKVEAFLAQRGKRLRRIASPPGWEIWLSVIR
jgi:hypothetical protein